jgi:hypothetical protein
VPTLEAAIAELRTVPAEAVLVDPAALAATPRWSLSTACADLLEQAGQGTGIVGADGTFLWANPKLLTFRRPWIARATAGGVRGPAAPERAAPGSTASNGGHARCKSLPFSTFFHRGDQGGIVVWDCGCKC